jgi:hypothetical protein
MSHSLGESTKTRRIPFSETYNTVVFLSFPMDVEYHRILEGFLFLNPLQWRPSFLQCLVILSAEPCPW